MAEYAMVIKNQKNPNGLVFKTKSSSLEEATNYFSRLKDLPLDKFKELFTVTEVKYKNQNNETY
jgi:hypothetical protein